MELQKSWELRTIFSSYVSISHFIYYSVRRDLHKWECREKREPTVVSATAEFFLAVTRFDMYSLLYLIFYLFYIQLR